jgi:regulator of RNase E activity RraA
MSALDTLAPYEGLRVADVRDAMDALMMHPIGSMDPGIRPLWRTRVCGVARTAKYLPYEGTIPRMSPTEYADWSGWYYGNVCTYPWMAEIQPGDLMVIDMSGVDCGLMGSENTLAGMAKGARGYVAEGGVRDTDEIILQEVPFWSRLISQSMVQGRLQFADADLPVEVGGVVVNPGDVVVADGDGVIVVPCDAADDVAALAREVLDSDRAARRQHYEEAGRELDDTVS